MKKRLARIGKTGAWLTATSNKLDGTTHSVEEWRDNARIRYGFNPPSFAIDVTGVRIALQWSTGSTVRRVAWYASAMTMGRMKPQTCAQWL